jgi:hypothetical protein
MGEVKRFPEKEPEPISEEQEEREFAEAQNASPAKPSPTAALASQKSRRRQPFLLLTGKFYYCPKEWVKQAAAVLHSAKELRIALEIYRLWKIRPTGADTIICSNVALDLSWTKSSDRRAKARLLRKLTKAGLVKREANGTRNAPRISVQENGTAEGQVK